MAAWSLLTLAWFHVRLDTLVSRTPAEPRFASNVKNLRPTLSPLRPQRVSERSNEQRRSPAQQREQTKYDLARAHTDLLAPRASFYFADLHVERDD